MNAEERIAARKARKIGGIRERVVISPIPLSAYIETIPEDGVAMRYMFPADGIIKKACLYVEGIGKLGINIKACLENEVGIFGRELATRKVLNIIEMDISVITGDRLTISAEGECTGLWVSVLWQPKRSELSLELLEEGGNERV